MSIYECNCVSQNLNIVTVAGGVSRVDGASGVSGVSWVSGLSGVSGMS